MSVQTTAPGRAYRAWGIGAIACLVLAGLGVLAGVPLIAVGTPGWAQVTGWVTLFVLGPAGLFAALYCGHRRYRAWFANAHVSEGVIEEVAVVRDSDSGSSYYVLTVSAEMDDGSRIRRHCTMGGDLPRPQIGQTLRFRHTSLDPEDLPDALFDGVRERLR